MQYRCCFFWSPRPCLVGRPTAIWQTFSARCRPVNLFRAPTITARPRAARRSAKVFAGDKLVGYAFVNADWVNSTGYSGQPIQILVGLTAGGQDRRRAADGASRADRADRHSAGAHRRLHPGLCRARRAAASATTGRTERPAVDIVSGATVTVTVIAESMVRSAIRVARAEGIGGPAPAEVDGGARDRSGARGAGGLARACSATARCGT